jgi:hypothetical protein
MLRIRHHRLVDLLVLEGWVPAQQVAGEAVVVEVVVAGFSVAVVEVEVQLGDLQEVL